MASDTPGTDWIRSKWVAISTRSVEMKPTTRSMPNWTTRTAMPAVPMAAKAVAVLDRAARSRICQKVDTNSANAAMKARCPTVQAIPGPRLPSSPSRMRITP
jgi:hypothetical protein